MMPKAEAMRLFEGRGEPLKVQLIDEKGGPVVSCYTIADVFVDFCLGPHVPSTGRLKAFKLLSASNAYWKGDANNQPMQRIHGTAFLSESDLKAHLERIEEAKKRDHRKLGKELGLFMFHPWAPGEPFWLEKGTRLVNTLTNYMRAVLAPEGYKEMRTPLVFNKALWETSGHWQHYRENMFLFEAEEQSYGLKPMNCPGHMLVFASEVRSYRDLPYRIHDQSVLHRYEASGVLSGLTRVREFIMDDAHIFLAEDQIGEEVERLLRLIQRVYGDFGLTPEMKLSTRPEQYLGEKATWDHAESALKTALAAAGVPYTINEGDGAFYGPKIDFAVTDALGRKWQCATVQLDYQLPQRFKLKYIGADNTEHTPVVMHRAIFGSVERFVALLLEHYAGALPTWFAPVQATVLPIADRHQPYAAGVRDRLATARRRSATRSGKRSCRRCPTCSSSATGKPSRVPCRSGAGPGAISGPGRSTRSSRTSSGRSRGRAGRRVDAIHGRSISLLIAPLHVVTTAPGSTNGSACGKFVSSMARPSWASCRHSRRW
jgi:threonyl-tRNA synthetase